MLHNPLTDSRVVSGPKSVNAQSPPCVLGRRGAGIMIGRLWKSSRQRQSNQLLIVCHGEGCEISFFKVLSVMDYRPLIGEAGLLPLSLFLDFWGVVSLHAAGVITPTDPPEWFPVSVRARHAYRGITDGRKQIKKKGQRQLIIWE